MTDHNSGDLDRRVTSALGSLGDAMPESTPPTFSWEPAQSVALDQPAGRRHRGAIYAGTGLVAAATAATLVVALGGGGAGPRHDEAHSLPGSPQTTHAVPSAPQLLLAAAKVRLQTGDPTLADGQYRYVRITSPAPGLIEYGRSGKPRTVPAPAGSYTLDQYWIPKDQTDVWLRRQSVVGDPSQGPALVWKGRCDDLYAHTQDGPKGAPCTRAGSFDDPTPAFIAGLPRDADALYAQLHAYAEQRLNPDKIHDADFEMFTLVDSLLDAGVVPGDLTSTLYGVLSRIPGIEVIDGARNYAGVAGTGFRLSTVLGSASDGLRDTQTIIVDLRSGAYLGDRDVSAGQDYSSAVTTGVATRLGRPGH